MPDGDRYPSFIASKFKSSLKCLNKAPEMVGQAVAATVIKDFKRDAAALEPAMTRIVSEVERLLSIPLDQRRDEFLDVSQTCTNRNEKLLARAALKIWNLQFCDAQLVSPVEVRHALGSEYVKQQIEASFISPVQFQVQQGTMRVDESFEKTLIKARLEADFLVAKALLPWSQSNDVKTIPRISVPQVEVTGTSEILSGSNHDEVVNVE